MKKQLLLLLTLSLLSTSMLIGCGETTKQEDTTVSVESSVHESTEISHEHTYTETITISPTCETDGEATYTCECGDSYTETIKATGHVFENYVSNNDATYLADGTETSKCSNCDVTDTRTAEGSMLTYTYTDMDATMYAQQTVNVRSMPSTDGEKLGSLSTNDEVKVTGQCAETSWYRIEFDGNAAYVSNSYLGADKVVVEQPKTEQTAQTSSSSEFPYQLWTMYDNGTVAWFYMPENHGYPDEYSTAYRATSDFNHSHFTLIDGQIPGFDEACIAAGSTGNPATGNYYTEWRVNGKRIQRYFAW